MSWTLEKLDQIQGDLRSIFSLVKIHGVFFLTPLSPKMVKNCCFQPRKFNARIHPEIANLP